MKAVPVMTTTHPDGPLVGENDEMFGGAAKTGGARPNTSKDTTTATATTRTPGRCLRTLIVAPFHMTSSRMGLHFASSRRLELLK